MRFILPLSAITVMCMALGACGDDETTPSGTTSGGKGGEGGDPSPTGTGGAGEGGSGGSGGAAPAGRPDGDPCSANEECEGGLCLTEERFGWAQGYCSALCQAELAPCAEGSVCLAAGDYSICAKSCAAAADCGGTGQTCVDLAGDGSLQACLGGCASDDQCKTACDDDSKLCVAAGEVCDNGADDDQDQFMDCEELDCASDATCAAGISAACAGAVDVSGDGTFVGTTADGTSLFAARCPGFLGDTYVGSGLREKVYKYVAPAQGVVTLSVAATEGNLDWYIRTSCDDPSTFVGCPGAQTPDNPPATLETQAGDTFYLYVDGQDGDAEYELNVSFQEQVCGDGQVVGTEPCDDGNASNNDACTTACEVNTAFLCTTATPLTAAGGSGDTTSGVSGFQGSCGGLGTELVYRYVPTTTGTVTITATPESTGDLVLYARTGCDDAGTEIDCKDGGFDGDPETIEVPVTVGTPISIFVDGWSAATGGAFALSITER